ncbi:hypothetical protein N5P37_004239 [Trichoderma harzianum]|uniref:Uncharacterized protein n=1 Tax=Trichoderma harzianum CBS 226.95 TaxID=983964 RepID=A0A2T4ANA4_TRIHA|nr:hypothetical protein M431DRAFT_280259 [Trichoderma harzianum CBS 226.95]KAK0763253.1 hypothetical protein N5P37_004239 [Trichoderma harzianum]PTB58547.1 hypothetical protein M431DRAFT_280259 [Trichoderma harzianum CBS 226.95]
MGLPTRHLLSCTAVLSFQTASSRSNVRVCLLHRDRQSCYQNCLALSTRRVRMTAFFLFPSLTTRLGFRLT